MIVRHIEKQKAPGTRCRGLHWFLDLVEYELGESGFGYSDAFVPDTVAASVALLDDLD